MRYVILLLGIAFSIVNAAAADPITLTFDGTLDSLYPPSEGRGRVNPFGLGDAFHFAITFNSLNRPILRSCLRTPTLD